MTKRYNHAFSLGFEIESHEPDGSDVTHPMLLNAIARRLLALQEGYNVDPARRETLVDACDAPWDTFEVTP